MVEYKYIVAQNDSSGRNTQVKVVGQHHKGKILQYK